MKITGLKEITRKDVPIYYRLLYTGVAVIELMNVSASDYRFDFCVEIEPSGMAKVTVSFLDDIHYPLLPVIRELKKIINAMHSDGSLPD